MATKTFKAGEVAYGGKIKVVTSKTQIKISFLDWNTNQVIISQNFQLEGSRNEIDRFISDNATTYWASKILDWIQEKEPKFKSRPKYFSW
jgi:hypothetical protein